RRRHTVDLTDHLVFGESVERLAQMSPLPAAILTLDHAPLAERFGTSRSQQRRPLFGALPVTRRLVGLVFRVAVQRHTPRIGVVLRLHSTRPVWKHWAAACRNLDGDTHGCRHGYLAAFLCC